MSSFAALQSRAAATAVGASDHRTPSPHVPVTPTSAHHLASPVLAHPTLAALMTPPPHVVAAQPQAPPSAATNALTALLGLGAPAAGTPPSAAGSTASTPPTTSSLHALLHRAAGVAPSSKSTTHATPAAPSSSLASLLSMAEGSSSASPSVGGSLNPQQQSMLSMFSPMPSPTQPMYGAAPSTVNGMSSDAIARFMSSLPHAPAPAAAGVATASAPLPAATLSAASSTLGEAAPAHPAPQAPVLVSAGVPHAARSDAVLAAATSSASAAVPTASAAAPATASAATTSAVKPTATLVTSPVITAQGASRAGAPSMPCALFHGPPSAFNYLAGVKPTSSTKGFILKTPNVSAPVVDAVPTGWSVPYTSVEGTHSAARAGCSPDGSIVFVLTGDGRALHVSAPRVSGARGVTKQSSAVICDVACKQIGRLTLIATSDMLGSVCVSAVVLHHATLRVRALALFQLQDAALLRPGVDKVLVRWHPLADNLLIVAAGTGLWHVAVAQPEACKWAALTRADAAELAAIDFFDALSLAPLQYLLEPTFVLPAGEGAVVDLDTVHVCHMSGVATHAALAVAMSAAKSVSIWSCSTPSGSVWTPSGSIACPREAAHVRFVSQVVDAQRQAVGLLIAVQGAPTVLLHTLSTSPSTRSSAEAVAASNLIDIASAGAPQVFSLPSPDAAAPAVASGAALPLVSPTLPVSMRVLPCNATPTAAAPAGSSYCDPPRGSMVLLWQPHCAEVWCLQVAFTTRPILSPGLALKALWMWVNAVSATLPTPAHAFCAGVDESSQSLALFGAAAVGDVWHARVDINSCAPASIACMPAAAARREVTFSGDLPASRVVAAAPVQPAVEAGGSASSVSSAAVMGSPPAPSTKKKGKAAAAATGSAQASAVAGMATGVVSSGATAATVPPTAAASEAPAPAVTAAETALPPISAQKSAAAASAAVASSVVAGASTPAKPARAAVVDAGRKSAAATAPTAGSGASAAGKSSSAPATAPQVPLAASGVGMSAPIVDVGDAASILHDVLATSFAPAFGPIFERGVNAMLQQLGSHLAANYGNFSQRMTAEAVASMKRVDAMLTQHPALTAPVPVPVVAAPQPPTTPAAAGVSEAVMSQVLERIATLQATVDSMSQSLVTALPVAASLPAVLPVVETVSEDGLRTELLLEEEEDEEGEVVAGAAVTLPGQPSVLSVATEGMLAPPTTALLLTPSALSGSLVAVEESDLDGLAADLAAALEEKEATPLLLLCDRIFELSRQSGVPVYAIIGDVLSRVDDIAILCIVSQLCWHTQLLLSTNSARLFVAVCREMHERWHDITESTEPEQMRAFVDAMPATFAKYKDAVEHLEVVAESQRPNLDLAYAVQMAFNSIVDRCVALAPKAGETDDEDAESDEDEVEGGDADESDDTDEGASDDASFEDDVE